MRVPGFLRHWIPLLLPPALLIPDSTVLPFCLFYLPFSFYRSGFRFLPQDFTATACLPPFLPYGSGFCSYWIPLPPATAIPPAGFLPFLVSPAALPAVCLPLPRRLHHHRSPACVLALCLRLLPTCRAVLLVHHRSTTTTACTAVSFLGSFCHRSVSTFWVGATCLPPPAPPPACTARHLPACHCTWIPLVCLLPRHTACGLLHRFCRRFCLPFCCRVIFLLPAPPPATCVRSACLPGRYTVTTVSGSFRSTVPLRFTYRCRVLPAPQHTVGSTTTRYLRHRSSVLPTACRLLSTRFPAAVTAPTCLVLTVLRVYLPATATVSACTVHTWTPLLFLSFYHCACRFTTLRCSPPYLLVSGFATCRSLLLLLLPFRFRSSFSSCDSSPAVPGFLPFRL